jgi:hypothetical protein
MDPQAGREVIPARSQFRVNQQRLKRTDLRTNAEAAAVPRRSATNVQISIRSSSACSVRRRRRVSIAGVLSE